MEKVNYDPVKKTGVLSSSLYEDGNVLVLGANTHLALIEGSEHKFAALEVLSAKDKSGNAIVLQKQSCEDGNFAVFAISPLKTKKVFSEDSITSSRRLSGGMSIADIIALEAGKEYRIVKNEDGWKKPFGWTEGDPLVQNNSYRLEAVTTAKPATESKPTTKK